MERILVTYDDKGTATVHRKGGYLVNLTERQANKVSAGETLESLGIDMGDPDPDQVEKVGGPRAKPGRKPTSSRTGTTSLPHRS